MNRRNLISSAFAVTVLVMVIVLAAAILGVVGPTTEGAKAAVEASGYTSVEVSDWVLLGAQVYCSENDLFYFPVNGAINANGQTISNMYVCAGFFKGYTIRYH